MNMIRYKHDDGHDGGQQNITRVHEHDDGHDLTWCSHVTMMDMKRGHGLRPFPVSLRLRLGTHCPCRLAFLLSLQSVRDGIRQRRCASEGHECCCSGSTTIEHLYRSVGTPCRWVDYCFGFCFFIGRGGGENCLDSVRFLAPQWRRTIIVILLWRSFFSTRSSMSLASWGCGANPHIILFQVPVSVFLHMRIQYVENVRFRVFFSSGCFQYYIRDSVCRACWSRHELMACRWSWHLLQ